MTKAAESKPRQRRSFGTRLMVLVALAVVLPALFTCVILGIQLNRQARNLFANGLAASLETFALVLQDAERNVSEGLARMAADNTLQVTLDLEMKSQLNKYLDAQRQVLGMSFVAVFSADSRAVAFSGDESQATPWRFARPGEAPGAGCVVARERSEQLAECDGALYLIAAAPVVKLRDTSLGDAGRDQGSQILGSILGGLPVANSSLIGELLSRRVLHPLIWAGGKLVYSNLPTDEALVPASFDGVAHEYDVGQTAYLGVAQSLLVGAQTLDYGLVMPLDPLQETLRRSLETVAGIGLLVVIATMIAISISATRLLRPIEQLRQGAARIGSGDLAQRIAVKSGDEFEALADQFNDMAGRLQESYADLEHKVETRTRDLAKSLQDLHAAQDRLVQTEKLASLGQLTAGIAHEIKNPLNFVNNFSGVSVELIDELKDALVQADVGNDMRGEVLELADTLRGNLEKVVQHGKRADSIVKNMLLHSRQGSGERRPVDINALVEESLNLAYHGARAEKPGFNITLERAFDPAAGEADLFPQEITRVLLNLIGNGFYATMKRKAESGDGGYAPTLLAATRDLGDKVEIRIRDNGTGIPPDVRDKIFNPFFTTKPAGEGTGLGLSLSHDVVVKQHGGAIEVDTEAGAFTEIRIILPRGAAAAKAAE